MDVYLVGVVEGQETDVHSVHKTKNGAENAWEKKRVSLIETYKSRLNGAKRHDKDMVDKYQKHLEKLKSAKPGHCLTAVAVYMVPFMEKYELED